MAPRDEIAKIVRALNACWLEGRWDDLRGHFHEDVTLVMPGFEDRVEGAGPVVESYRDFGGKATIHSFETSEPAVDVLGPAAVATSAFVIDYDYEGDRYREGGTDVLVFTETGGEWRVRWRTIVPKSGPEA